MKELTRLINRGLKKKKHLSVARLTLNVGAGVSVHVAGHKGVLKNWRRKHPFLYGIFLRKPDGDKQSKRKYCLLTVKIKHYGFGICPSFPYFF